MEPLTGAERARYRTIADGGGTDLLSARYLAHSFNRHTHPAYRFAVITAGAEQYPIAASSTASPLVRLRS